MSGIVDNDVTRGLQSGRETLGSMLSAAQSHLQKVFIVFVVGLIATILFLRNYGWDRMKADLLAEAPEATIVAVTPFDVILLQVKIGLVVGVFLSIPFLIYYSRDALKERGYWPTGVPRWKIALVVAGAVLLLFAGAAYGYLLFFPVVFDFLAANAAAADISPTYSIVKWVQFVFLLSLSFGLAAQLPLAMSGMALSGVVPYETFRDYWKHAIVVLYAAGAIFTPPDPLTQLMWATPLVVLYAFSLGLTRFLVTAQAAGRQVGLKPTARKNWNVLAGVGFLTGAVTFLLGRATFDGQLDGVMRMLESLPYFGPSFAERFPQTLTTDTLFGVDAVVVVAVAAALVAAVAAFAVTVVLMFRALDAVADRSPRVASTGDPADLDLSELDAAGIRAAPPEPFEALTEDEALALASGALDDGDDAKAQAILDRYDEIAEQEEDADTDADGEPAAGTTDDPAPTEPVEAEEEGTGNVVSETGAGMLSAFTADDVDEDDIGGYYHDIAFIASSLRSKAFVLVGTFMVVLAAMFSWLYTGGIGWLKASFLGRLAEGFSAEQVNTVALHPVEALIFEIKLSIVVGAVATIPLLLYFAWPALKERGFASGDRRVLFVWGGSVLATLSAGTVVGFLFVAPRIISWLANDALTASMVIAYRINNFGWMVFFTTVGVGLLFCIPVTMWLFHAGGLVSYQQMRDRWRVVTLAVLTVVAFASPQGVFMMFLLGIPVVGMYFLGLAVLHIVTLGGRRGGSGGRPRAAD
ncbi:twin-arginine translocase subunit TatC [Halosegnis longus]|uniref:Sec-independent protein translocase protein TatC n=1 Tax=Halosegnis longus TaxID=2216012 RepID=A0AAJ4UUW6_9EURY|nr:twin-arginine translocase subunit TatC [Halosegnis longus]RNJ25400.1 preprotein translocase subunit TatC [Salella cibi]